MSLFKRAPAIEIHAPAVMFAGHPARIGITLDAPEPIDLDWIEARMWGVQGWVVGSGKSRRSSNVRFPDLVNRIAERGRLPAGRTQLEATFTPPAEMPPSHEIEPAYARAYVQVRLSIPWWPDAKLRQTLAIRVVGPPGIARAPFVTAGDAHARIGLALASTRLVAGEPIVGTCAVRDIPDDEPREVDLVLVPNLTLASWWRDFTRPGAGLMMKLVLPAGSGGRSVPFQFPTPRDLTPMFAAKTHRLAWELHARVGGFLFTRAEVRVPLDIVDPTTPVPPGAARFAPPLLADQRVVAAFQAFAQHRDWRPAIAADDGVAAWRSTVDPHVERAAGHAVLRLGYAYRGDAGAAVLGRVEYPSLGLGLMATPASALRHVFFHDVEAGIAAWDRAHHVRARSAEQTAPFLRRVVPATARELGDLVRWDDDAIELEVGVVGEVTPAWLSALADRLEELAGVIATARAEIAAPPGVAVDRAAWQELASALDGTVGFGNLSIDGALGGQPVTLGLTWTDDGEPDEIRVAVGDPSLASGTLRAVALAMPAPALAALTTPDAEPIAGILTGWPADVVDLRVADGVAAAAWRLPDDRRADAHRVRELVHGLREVLAALEPGGGPYR